MYGRRRHFFWVVKRKASLTALIVLIIIGFIFFTGLMIIEKNLRPTISAYADAKAKQIAVDSINNVINEKIVPNVEYQDLVKIHKNSESKVTLVEPNIIKINRLEAEAATEINKTLKNLGKSTIKVPLGQVLGSQLLANYGPKVKVSFMPIGTVNIVTKEQLDEAGINQTRHKMYFDITGEVKVVIPMETTSVKVSTEILIADDIIIGDVPNTVVRIESGSKSIKDLIDENK